MQKITKIIQAVKNKQNVNIYLDNQYWINIPAKLLVDFNLYKDKEISQEEKQKLEEVGKTKKIIERLQKFLSLRPRSEKEVRDRIRLKYEVDPKTLEEVLTELKYTRQIDDFYFCDWFIRNRLEFKKIGLNKIKAELLAKGVKSEVIKDTLKNYTNEDLNEVEKIQSLAEKKLPQIKAKNEYEKIQKLKVFLLTKGFSFESINKALKTTLD